MEFKSNISSRRVSSHDPLRRILYEAFLNVNRKDGSAVRNYSSAQRAIERKPEDLPLLRPTSFNDILIPDELKVTNGGDRFVLYDNEDPNHTMIILSSDDDLDSLIPEQSVIAELEKLQADSPDTLNDFIDYYEDNYIGRPIRNNRRYVLLVIRFPCGIFMFVLINNYQERII
ncbi:unnamed protein product [Rotaria magnacalcarata]